MAFVGPNFYDDDAVFTTYSQRRARVDSPNDTLELPVILELVRPVAHQRILDLGCGDAAIGPLLLQEGAAGYLGIEGSHKMAALAAQTLAESAGQVIEQRVEEWVATPATFDLVLARLVLHYIADLMPIFAKVCDSLAPRGRFVFSVEHPVITSCARGWAAGTQRQDWVVDDYFEMGLRVTNWLGGDVEKYHRTIEEYCRLLQGAGLFIETLREAHPHPENFVDPATFARRKRIPLFLILAARKPL